MKVRTRVAPSPTGDPHIGTAYIALANYLFAKQCGGEWILRIEDTDLRRSSRKAEDAILESLKWLNLNWAEGPDIGGPYGPYRQSERLPIYDRHVRELLSKGHAFHCFCTAERLEQVKREKSASGEKAGYDGHCLELSQGKVDELLSAGTPHVVRMRVPNQGSCEVRDVLRDTVSIPWKEIDMQILQKADGFPTYHLASVVDDHLMEITHVIRGEEWLSSAPKHLLLYQYFGWTPPVFCHVALLRNPDKSKLSKRKNPTGIDFYRRSGYLPEGIVNFLGLFLETAAEGEELRTLRELVEKFSLEALPVGGPVFDVEKLNWLNARWIREKFSPAELRARLLDWLESSVPFDKVLELVRPRVKHFNEFVPTAGFLYGDISGQEKLVQGRDASAVEGSRQILKGALEAIELAENWEKARIEECIRQASEAAQVKLRDFVKVLFVALTGKESSLPLFDSMECLGRERCRERLRSALKSLGKAPATP